MIILFLLLVVPCASSLTNHWLKANVICLQSPDGDYELAPCSSIYARCVGHRTFLMQCDRVTWVFSKEHHSCKPPAWLYHCKFNLLPYLGTTYCTAKDDGLYASGPCSASYFICYDQKTYAVRCQLGQVFSPFEHRCVSQERVPECQQSFQAWTFYDLCADRLADGLELPLAACSPEYIFCRQGFPIFANCSFGYTYNVGVGCVAAWQNPFCQQASQTVALRDLITASQFCVYKPDGIYIPRASVCNSKAIICSKNKANLLLCPDKQYYSVTRHRCLPLDTGWCNYVTTPKETDLGNQMIAYSCARFGHRFHGPNKCSTWYLHCYPEKQLLIHCPQGTVYDEVTDRCVVQSACDPWSVTFCSEKYGNSLMQLVPCSETYLVCYENQTIIMTCPNEMVFSAEHNTCVQKEICKQSLRVNESLATCSPTQNNLIPIAPCAQQYLRCWNGHLQTLYCTDGLIFDPNLEICVEPSSSLLCGQYDGNPCKDRADGFYNVNRCSAVYLHCERSQPSWLYCAPGSVFDPVNGSCVPAKFQACTLEQRTACQGRMDGPIDPWTCKDALIVCLSGVATAKPCPNPLPRKMVRCVSAACEGSRNPCSPWTNDKRALEPCSGTYVVCLYGYPYSQVCPDGKVFFTETKSCVPRSANRFCSTSSLCSASSNEVKALGLCSGMYVACLGGKSHTLTCPAGQVFYTVSKQCVPKSSNHYCKVNPFCSPHVNEQKALAPCSGTYVACLNGRMFTQVCPGEQVFYNETLSCTAKQNNRYCFNVGDDCTVEGEFFPEPNDCTVFYRCTHGAKIRFTCPPGTGFNYGINVCDWKANVPSCKGL